MTEVLEIVLIVYCASNMLFDYIVVNGEYDGKPFGADKDLTGIF